MPKVYTSHRRWNAWTASSPTDDLLEQIEDGMFTFCLKLCTIAGFGLIMWDTLKMVFPRLDATIDKILDATRVEINKIPEFRAYYRMHTCTICLNDVRATEANHPLRCGHVFHYDCLEEWKNQVVIPTSTDRIQWHPTKIQPPKP